jgi:hypothetical protein
MTRSASRTTAQGDCGAVDRRVRTAAESPSAQVGGPFGGDVEVLQQRDDELLRALHVR